MAQKQFVELIDDLDGKPATETVEFSLDGIAYEIDLSEHHSKELRDLFDKYVEVARVVKKTKKYKPSGIGYTEVREWAKANGVEVSERGRVSNEVIAAFKKAQTAERTLVEPSLAPDSQAVEPDKKHSKKKDSK